MTLQPKDNERFEIYLDAVLGFITDVTPDEREALRAELREHLMALYTKFRPECVFDEDAVEMAIRKFGPAWRVGPALNRMTPAGQVRRIWRRQSLMGQAAMFFTKFGFVFWVPVLVLLMAFAGHFPSFDEIIVLNAVATGATEAIAPRKQAFRWNFKFSLRVFAGFEALGLLAIALPDMRSLFAALAVFWLIENLTVTIVSRLWVKYRAVA